MIRFAAPALVLLLSAAAGAAQAPEPHVNRDPERVRFITSDIDNFWSAYDAASREPDRAKRIAIYQREYLDRGSAGLRDFLRMRIKSAEELAAAIERQPRYYASTRASTLRVREMEGAMRASFRRFKALYPDAVFPDVYFVMGAASTGGTVSENGLLIGTEMYAATPSTPRDELPAWMKAVLTPIDALPAIVTHESCHFNQKLPEPTTLLAKAIQEGSCDFVSELVSGATINPGQHAYGDRHEARLWREFQVEMDSAGVRNWMYNGATAGDRPTDLGYYMGYRIARAYHDRAADKRQALRDILNIRDFRDFAARSRYSGSSARARRPARAPVPPRTRRPAAQR
jgi:hypothetical protein